MTPIARRRLLASGAGLLLAGPDRDARPLGAGHFRPVADQALLATLELARLCCPRDGRHWIDGDALRFSGGPSVTWNIFNYGRIKNNVRVQDARLQQLLVNYQNTVLSAGQEVEDAMDGFLASQETTG